MFKVNKILKILSWTSVTFWVLVAIFAIDYMHSLKHPRYSKVKYASQPADVPWVGDRLCKVPHIEKTVRYISVRRGISEWTCLVGQIDTSILTKEWGLYNQVYIDGPELISWDDHYTPIAAKMGIDIENEDYDYRLSFYNSTLTLRVRSSDGMYLGYFSNKYK